MKKKFGLLALSLPAAFAVGCNLDTGIKVSWTGTCPANSFIRVSGTSSSGAAARETCGTTSGTSCVTGTQVISCSAGTVTILNWASGVWTIKVELLDNLATSLGSAYLSCKTVTEGQVNDLGSVALASGTQGTATSCGGGGGVDAGGGEVDAGGGGTTTVAINFTFAGAGNTSCASANLASTGGAADQYRGLRYKLTCGADTSFKNTTGTMAEQNTLCATTPTAVAATAYAAGSGSCTLEAQLLSSTNNSLTSWEHCDYYATTTVTVTAGQANTLPIDLTVQSGGTCPLTKQLW
jgi:hypothetical protein